MVRHRSKKTVLKDATNQPKATKKKSKNIELDESGLRSFIFAFYMSNKSQRSFLEDNNLSRDKFRKRWDRSGLRELKKTNVPYADAKIQYDFWFCKWKGGLCKQKQLNGSTSHGSGFAIYDDLDNADADADADANANADADADADADDTTTVDNDVNVDAGTDDDDGDGDVEVIDVLDDNDNDGEEEEIKKKSPPTKKLKDYEMKDLLFEFYLTTDGIKLLTFIRDKGRLANKKGIQTHWKDSGLGLMKLQQKSVAPAIVAYNRWQEDEKKKNGIKNKANGASEKAIPVELELFMRCLIKQLALCGQGIGKIAAKQIFVEALKDGSNDGRFSRSTLNRFIQNYELECKNVKNIDPARISQVTEENRDALFFRLDQVVMLLHTIDSTNCPWKNWAEVGAEFKYNMDEMGTDPTKFRDLLLIPQEIIHRIFQSTPEGDRPSVHCSVAQFSRSDGKYKDAKAKIEGAPMQMVIHSIQSKKKSNSSAAERRIGLYEQQETPPVHDKYTDGFQRHKNLGIIVCTSINGSMTKELFLVAVEHLVENIASDQGANGLYSFLLLDSHVSRWNPRALYLLFKNRIIPVFFPSHLSIVVQPQDNGVILFLHKCLEEASLMDRLFATET